MKKKKKKLRTSDKWNMKNYYINRLCVVNYMFTILKLRKKNFSTKHV